MRYVRTVSTRFERLVGRLSTHFITLPLEGIDVGVDQALGELAGLCDVDRAYIFQFDGGLASKTHEWCREGIAPHKERFQGVPLQAFPWWAATVLDGDVVNAGALDELPPEARAERAILEAQSVQSIVSVPLALGSTTFGFVGFDSVQKPRRWSEEVIAVLRVVGEMVVNALVRQRAERHRRALEAQLGEARRLEMVGRLAGGVAHDFNNLLTIVMNLGLILESSVGDPTQRAHAREIVETAEHAAGLTRQLLSIGRRGRSRETIDLALVLRELEPLLQRTLRGDVSLRVDIEPVKCVRVSRVQVEQILVNLTLNARDAMPEGGELRFRLRPVAGEGEESVELIVEDTGVGMPPEVADRAFELFFTTKGARGTGLGLVTVRGIVEESKGTITLDSQPGAGTRFVIRWPATDARPSYFPPPACEHETQGGGELVLVVEAVEELRNVVEAILEKAGYRVLTAANAATALEVVRRSTGPIDLVLTDLVMPGESGTELVRHLESLESPPKLIVMSAYGDPALEELVDSVARVLKPFQAETLLRTIHATLHGEGCERDHSTR